MSCTLTRFIPSRVCQGGWLKFVAQVTHAIISRTEQNNNLPGCLSNFYCPAAMVLPNHQQCPCRPSCTFSKPHCATHSRGVDQVQHHQTNQQGCHHHLTTAYLAQLPGIHSKMVLPLGHKVCPMATYNITSQCLPILPSGGPTNHDVCGRKWA